MIAERQIYILTQIQYLHWASASGRAGKSRIHARVIKSGEFFCLWSELSLCSGLKFNHLVAGKLRNARSYRVSVALQIDRNSAWCQEGLFNPGQAEVDFGMVKRGKFLNDFDAATA